MDTNIFQQHVDLRAGYHQSLVDAISEVQNLQASQQLTTTLPSNSPFGKYDVQSR